MDVLYLYLLSVAVLQHLPCVWDTTMPVDVSVLTKVNEWLEAMEKNHSRGEGLEGMKKQDHWRDLSKTASYAIPSMLAKSFMFIFSMRDQLVKMHEDPDLIASQRQVIDLQAELIQCKNDQLQSLQAAVKNSVEDTVKAEFKSYSRAVQENLPQPTIAPEIVKSIVQTVVQEKDRSRSFIVFNLPDEEEEQLCSKVEEVLQELGEKPVIEACRLGTRRKDTATARPVKVILSSSVAVNQILAKAKRLRTSPRHKSVFICQDRSPADRAQHRLLVEELKNKRSADPSKKYYIKGGVVCDGGLRKNDT